MGGDGGSAHEVALLESPAELNPQVAELGVHPILRDALSRSVAEVPMGDSLVRVVAGMPISRLCNPNGTT